MKNAALIAKKTISRSTVSLEILGIFFTRFTYFAGSEQLAIATQFPFERAAIER
jgi:hypothetical protein